MMQINAEAADGTDPWRRVAEFPNYWENERWLGYSFIVQKEQVAGKLF